MDTIIETLLSMIHTVLESPFDFGLLAIAAVALYVTRKQLNQAEETRLTQNKPNVVCYLVLTEHRMVELVIENIGNEPAYDVCFQTALSDMHSDSRFTAFKILYQGIRFLSVGQSHRLLLGAGDQLLKESFFKDQEINVTFNHRDLSASTADRSFENHIILDFAVIRELITARGQVACRATAPLLSELQNIKRQVTALRETVREDK